MDTHTLLLHLLCVSPLVVVVYCVSENERKCMVTTVRSRRRSDCTREIDWGVGLFKKVKGGVVGSVGKARIIFRGWHKKPVARGSAGVRRRANSS